MYTFEACMDACVNFNYHGTMHDGSGCCSLTYVAIEVEKGNEGIEGLEKEEIDSAVVVE